MKSIWQALLGALARVAMLALIAIGYALIPVMAFLGLVLKPFQLLFGWLFPKLCALLAWVYEAPRRLLSDTILDVTVGFRDSSMGLGEERVPPNEGDFIARTVELLETRHQRDYPPGVRPMPRDFHGKAHGCLAATFTIDEHLPSEARHGIFKALGKTYQAVVRFSNASRDMGSDRLPNQRGMAIKVILDDGRHQDFLLSDYPVNFIRDAEQSYYFYRAEAASRPLAYYVRNLHKFALTLLASQFQPAMDVFECHYFSQTPYRLGPKRACKYICRPVKPTEEDPDHVPVEPPRHSIKDLPSSPNFLRWQMEARLADGDPLVFAFFVQPQRNAVRQPVEDACFRWSEKEAPPIRVATITLRPSGFLPFTSPETQWHAERLTFDPQHALDDHKPIGGLNRVRAAVYAKFAAMRLRANGVFPLNGQKAMPPVCPYTGKEPGSYLCDPAPPPDAPAIPLSTS